MGVQIAAVREKRRKGSIYACFRVSRRLQSVLVFQEVSVLHIEPGIEMPETRTKYPFIEMEPGDSILFKTKNQAESARVASIRFAKVHKPDWVFSLRKVDNGWRLWRKA